MPSLAQLQNPLDPLAPIPNATTVTTPLASAVAPAANPTPQEPAYQAERIADPGTLGTVAGQVNQITGQDSPLMQAARTRAAQVMNRRGGLNTTMAGQAGEQAVIETALPMAQQDANTVNQRSILNQQAGNQALQMGAQGSQALAQIGASGTQQRQTQESAGSIQSRLAQEKLDIDKQLLTADTTEKLRLTNRQGEIETELQDARLAQNSTIEANRNTLATQLQTADLASRGAIVAQQLENERTLQANSILTQKWLANKNDALQRAMPGLEGAEREKQINLIFENDKAMLDEKLSYETSLREAMDVYDKGIITATGVEQRNQIAARGVVETQLLNSQLDTQKSLAREQRELETELQKGRITSTENISLQQRENDFNMNEARLAIQKTIADNSNALQTSLQTLQGTQALDLANVEAEYKTMLQASDSAVRHFMQISGDINRIMTDPEIELTSKQALIDQEIKLLRSGMEIIGSAAGVDFNALLDYGNL